MFDEMIQQTSMLGAYSTEPFHPGDAKVKDSPRSNTFVQPKCEYAKECNYMENIHHR